MESLKKKGKKKVMRISARGDFAVSIKSQAAGPVPLYPAFFPSFLQDEGEKFLFPDLSGVLPWLGALHGLVQMRIAGKRSVGASAHGEHGWGIWGGSLIPGVILP